MDRRKTLSLFNKYYQENIKGREKSLGSAKDLKIFYSGHVYDEKELVNMVDTSLDFWLTI